VRSSMFVAVFLFASPVLGQPAITPSQTRLIGCFGEAFTLVEHVWRIAPKHFSQLVEQSRASQGDARRQFLDGFVSAAVTADQESAFAVARNLDGCLDEARTTKADQATAILATAVRTELDSALEDVADYVAMVHAQEDSLRIALRTPDADARGSALDTYLTFGTRMRDELSALRRKADAVVVASTP
jgi:hypothetical protein